MLDSTPEYQDTPFPTRPKGRGAAINPGNRFETTRLHILGERLDEIAAEHPDGVRLATQVFDDKTRSILNPVDSPDIGFKWSVNPYRGCEHGCIYCYARPSHENMGFSSGIDFETRIVAKRDAPSLLRKAITTPRWRGEPICMSGITDPYQPVEARLEITRGCLKVMEELGQPVSIITKNRMVTRDLDLLRKLATANAAHVCVSITTLDNRLAATMEPRASSPRERLAAVRDLADAGVPVAVMTAPIIPGLTDHEVPALLKAAADAGAHSAGYVVVRLPYQNRDLFLDWLRRELPDRAAKVENAVRAMHGGALYRAAFGHRQRGAGVRADHLTTTFEMFARRYGLDRHWEPLSNTLFLERREAAKPKPDHTLFG